MSQADYLEETRRNRETAQGKMESAEREAKRFHQQANDLRNLVTAYDTILATTSALEPIYQTEIVMPLDVDVVPPVESTTPEVPTDDSTNRYIRVPRQPEFQHMALPQALDTLVETSEFHKVLTVDDFVDAIYDIDTYQQRATARRTFNGELSRAVQRGILLRVARGHFIPIDYASHSIPVEVVAG